MPKNRSQQFPVTDRKQGQYSDGHPLDEVQYLECKLILKPDRFTAAKVFLSGAPEEIRTPDPQIRSQVLKCRRMIAAYVFAASMLVARL
jgi:hypothetical protein